MTGDPGKRVPKVVPARPFEHFRLIQRHGSMLHDDWSMLPKFGANLSSSLFKRASPKVKK